jgi:VPDSG-CTERM motif
MKSLKYILLVGALYAGMTSAAHATLSDPFFTTLANNGAGTELTAFQTFSGHDDATMCVTQFGPSGGSITTPEGNFTFTLLGLNPATGHQEVEVNFTMNAGNVVCGFLTKNGAGNLVALYTVSEDEGSSGDFVLEIPSHGALSHIDVFCCPGGVTTPDGGATVMLLGAGLGALGMVRRYLKS